MEKFKQFIFQLVVFDFAQHITNIRHFILIMSIPTLLIVVIGIGCPISITESNIFHIIINSLSGRRRKIIFNRSLTQRIFSYQSIYKKTFTTTIRTYNSYMFIRSDS